MRWLWLTGLGTWNSLINWTTASVQFGQDGLAAENNVNGGSRWKRAQPPSSLSGEEHLQAADSMR
jgi:hypothetical protein